MRENLLIRDTVCGVFLLLVLFIVFIAYQLEYFEYDLKKTSNGSYNG